MLKKPNDYRQIIFLTVIFLTGLQPLPERIGHPEPFPLVRHSVLGGERDYRNTACSVHPYFQCSLLHIVRQKYVFFRSDGHGIRRNP